MKWFILLLGILSNALASVLIKVSVTHPRRFPSLEDTRAALTNWPFWLGLGLYGGAFLLYSAALTRLPLNVVHPVLTSGTVVSVAFFSIFLFREPFHWSTAAGIFLVIVGVALITLRVT